MIGQLSLDSRLSIFLADSMKERGAMNRYGQIAMEHWQAHAPSRVAQLEDPETFFRELGETADSQITTLSEQLEAREPAKQEYLDRVAQIASIRRQAEEIVLHELVFSVEPESATSWEELDEMLGQLPGPLQVQASMREIRYRAEDEAEREGKPEPTLSDWDRDEMARLERLLTLVDLPMEPNEMPQADVEARIAALRAFQSEQE